MQAQWKKFFIILPFFILSFYAGMVTIYGTEKIVNLSQTNIQTNQYPVLKAFLHFFPREDDTLSQINKLPQNKITDEFKYYELSNQAISLNKKERNFSFNRINTLRQTTWYYFSKLILPYNLIFLYPKELTPFFLSFLGIFILFILPSIFFFKFKAREYFLIPMCTVVFLSPYMGLNYIPFFIFSNISDHYAYLFVIVLCFLFNSLYPLFKNKKYYLRSLLAYMILIWYLNINYSLIFNNQLLLYQEISKNNPTPRILTYLFQEQVENNLLDDAKKTYLLAMQIDPNDPNTKILEIRWKAIEQTLLNLKNSN